MPGSQPSACRLIPFWLVRAWRRNIVRCVVLPLGGTIPKTADLLILKSFIKMSLSIDWNLDFLSLRKLSLANSNSSISVSSQFLIWPSYPFIFWLLVVGAQQCPHLSTFPRTDFLIDFFHFVVEVGAHRTRASQLFFLNCKNEILITLGSNGRNVGGAQFPTFYVLV